MSQFQFSEGGRTFTCDRGSSAATPDTLWWWVNVAGDSNRYAAFVSKPSDTQRSVRPRIVAYYEQLLADRARPPAPRAAWGRRPAAPEATGTPPSQAPAEVAAAE